MDDQTLRQQYKQTDNLLDVLRDPEVLKEMVLAEDNCMGTIGAGFPAYSHHSHPVDPDRLSQAMQKVRLQSILFTALEEMMKLANLGAGTAAAIAEARKRLRQQLQQLTVEQQSFFDELLAEEDLLHSPLNNQLKAKLYSLLSPADWSAIGQAATNALQTQWNEFMESAKYA
jgi:hypothetical protein